MRQRFWGTRLFAILTALVMPFGGAAPLPTSAGAERAERLPAPDTLPISFEPNVGQTDSQVAFLARGRGYTIFLTPVVVPSEYLEIVAVRR